MKLTLSLLLLSTTILLSGCQKVIDFYYKNRPQQPVASICKLDSIYPINAGNPALDRTTAAGVHYNQKGYPIVVNYTFMHYGTFKFPVHYMYDAKNRLVEISPEVDVSIVPGYLNGVPFPTKYVYEGNSSLPVRDTLFDLHSKNVIQVEDLFYDGFGRVNRVVYRRPGGSYLPEYEVKYEYDVKGNKQITLAYDGSTPPPIEYTDQPSLYSLHAVWRLIHKDYSRNSIKSAVASFTEQGLPLALTSNYSGYYGYEVRDASSPFTLFLGVESAVDLRFSYKCPSVKY